MKDSNKKSEKSSSDSENPVKKMVMKNLTLKNQIRKQMK